MGLKFTTWRVVEGDAYAGKYRQHLGTCSYKLEYISSWGQFLTPDKLLSNDKSAKMMSGNTMNETCGFQPSRREEIEHLS